MVLTSKQQLGLFLLALFAVASTVFLFPTPRAWLDKKLSKAPGVTISSFEECAQYFPVMESYPERCRTNTGESFTRDIGNELEKTNLIVSDTPRPGDTIKSPLILKGNARGYWFFEASAPIALYNKDGVLIAQSYIQAKDEWMTEAFVPFEGTIDFSVPPSSSGEKGTLVIKKDNPSGLPEHDDSLIIPIRF